MTWEEAVLWLRRQPNFEELVRSCFYDDPLLDAAKRYWHSAEWDAVRRYLPTQQGRALDIGAGRGVSSYALASEGWTVSALEPNSSDIVGAGAIRKLARETGLKIEAVEAEGESIPFPDNSFDLVYCRAALHHARNLGALCREAGRVLRPEGILIATREHVISQREDLPAFLNSHALHHLYGGEAAYLLREYKGAIADAKMRITHVLGPESPINLFPETTATIKKQWANKLRFPFPRLIPNFLLALRYRYSNTPGRLYSFIGQVRSS
jgi:SAM-dependent methyltransferase